MLIHFSYVLEAKTTDNDTTRIVSVDVPLERLIFSESQTHHIELGRAHCIIDNYVKNLVLGKIYEWYDIDVMCSLFLILKKCIKFSASDYLTLATLIKNFRDSQKSFLVDCVLTFYEDDDFSKQIKSKLTYNVLKSFNKHLQRQFSSNPIVYLRMINNYQIKPNKLLNQPFSELLTSVQLNLREHKFSLCSPRITLNGQTCNVVISGNLCVGLMVSLIIWFVV